LADNKGKLKMSKNKYRILLLSTLFMLFPAIPAISGSGDHLKPEDGVYGFQILNPYYEAVSERLLSDSKYRKCQAVVITSFKSETAVYIRYDDKKPASLPVVVSLKLVHPLWTQLNEYFEKNKGNLTDEVTQKKALSRIKSKVTKQEAEIESELAKLLETVWETALSQVKYEEKERLGLDGESIHYANFTLGIGYRAGQAWSPEERTITNELSELAKALREYPILSEVNRKTASKAMQSKAQALLARLKANK
jgi:hypothetical protein